MALFLSVTPFQDDVTRKLIRHYSELSDLWKL